MPSAIDLAASESAAKYCISFGHHGVSTGLNFALEETSIAGSRKFRFNGRTEKPTGSSTMPKATDNDLRIRVVEAVLNDGLSHCAAPRRFSVPVVRRCMRRLMDGTIEPLPMDGDSRSIFKRQHRRKVCRWLVKNTHTTIDEIRVRPAMQGLPVSKSMTGHLPVREDWSWRKRTGHASGQESEDVQKLRQAWKEVQMALSGRCVIFF